MNIIDYICDLNLAMRDQHMDGFSCFGQKQKLYQILWATEKALKDSPTFAGEDDWVRKNKE